MKILKGNMGWHHDSTYMPVQAKGAVFSAEEVPRVGGRTGFADMRAAYDALDPAIKARIEGLNAYHSLHYSQGRVGHQTKKLDGEYSGYGLHDGPVPLRPLVKTHPETGRKSLLAGRHAHNIPGLAQEESDRLLRELIDFACQPPRIYHHDWTPGDAVVGQSLPDAQGPPLDCPAPHQWPAARRRPEGAASRLNRYPSLAKRSRGPPLGDAAMNGPSTTSLRRLPVGMTVFLTLLMRRGSECARWSCPASSRALISVVGAVLLHVYVDGVRARDVVAGWALRLIQHSDWSESCSPDSSPNPSSGVNSTQGMGVGELDQRPRRPRNRP